MSDLSKGFGVFDEQPLPVAPQSQQVERAVAETVDEDDDLGREILVFEVGGHEYATELEGVREVIEAPEAKPVPCSAPYLKGVFTLRGEIVGLIDLGEKFETDLPVSTPRPALVVESSQGPLAVIVDRVSRIESVDPRHCTPPRGIETKVSSAYLRGFIQNDHGCTVWVDLRKLLSEDEYQSLANLTP